MSTDPTLKNISCLKTLALNILKNSSPDAIAKDIGVPELDPCSRCKEELFLYELKKPFTILVCGHIYHRSCLEDYVKDLPQCPKCAMEIESIDYVHSGTSEQSTLDLMQISPQMAQIASDQSQNIVTSDTTHISNPTVLDPLLFPDYTKRTQTVKPKSKKRLREE
ncbi:16137_t:CDS:1, partial [Gigaspora rosea]